MSTATTEAQPLNALPSDTPLPAGFKTIVGVGSVLQVLGDGDDQRKEQQAVLCVKSSQTATLIRDVWSSEPDDDPFGARVVATIVKLYGATSIRLHVPLTQPGVLRYVKHATPAVARTVGFLMGKSVDCEAACARLRPDIVHGPFASDADFDAWMHTKCLYYAHLFIQEGIGTDVKHEYDDFHAQTTKMIPQGRHTPKHHFRSMSLADGTLLGRAWFDMEPTTGVSHCYSILIEEEQRSKRFGAQLLAVWEQSAHELGAHTIHLHVYEENAQASALYRSYGFETLTNSFDLGKALTSNPR